MTSADVVIICPDIYIYIHQKKGIFPQKKAINDSRNSEFHPTVETGGLPEEDPLDWKILRRAILSSDLKFICAIGSINSHCFPMVGINSSTHQPYSVGF